MLHNKGTSGKQETTVLTSMFNYRQLLECNFLRSRGGEAMPVTKTTNKTEDSGIHTGPVITERELAEYLTISDAVAEKTGQRHRVEAFKIIQADVRIFHLSLDLSFKGDNCLVITTRKTPRIWRDLHSMIEHVRSLGFPEAPVTIQLLPRESNEKPSDEKGKKRST